MFHSTPRTAYNATVTTFDAQGDVVSRFVAAVVDGTIVRSSALQFTGLEETPAYEARLRSATLGSLGRVRWEITPGTHAFRAALTRS